MIPLEIGLLYLIDLIYFILFIMLWSEIDKINKKIK